METKKPVEVVELMLANDKFSSWLALQLEAIDLGSCRLTMTVQEPMLNGFSIAHGGISYSLADSALAFASNSYGVKCVSIETNISHLKSVNLGDCLTAEAKEIRRGRKIAWYQVEVRNQHQQLVAHFKGTVHVSTDLW